MVDGTIDFAAINWLVLDVDGVLTDGRLFLGTGGETLLAFHVHDGRAILHWRRLGGGVSILSARRHEGLNRRAAELGIASVHVGVTDKLQGYETILADHGLRDPHVACIGDDLPDLAPMRRCGFPAAPADAVPAVKKVSQYVTSRPGGGGAVAEVVELLLRKQGRWNRPETTFV
jgi:3-deoxy-D-manno-octulosonate 8-phosphate phosphatase (KDO 8-P phosphatase)